MKTHRIASLLLAAALLAAGCGRSSKPAASASPTSDFADASSGSDKLSAEGRLHTCLFEADSYDLKLIVDEHRVYLTTRENYLRQLRDRAEEEKIRNVPGVGGVIMPEEPLLLPAPPVGAQNMTTS